MGGVLGGIAFTVACVVLLWVFRRRRRGQKRTNQLSVDLMDAEEDDNAPRTMRQNELPQNYEPEPFMIPIPDPTVSEFDDDSSLRDPLSAAGTRTSHYTRAETPDRTSFLGVGNGVGVGGGSSMGSRKGGAPKPMRTVNFIQHQDAGPSNNEDREETETIELPPAYTMVRISRTSADDDPVPSTSAGN